MSSTIQNIINYSDIMETAEESSTFFDDMLDDDIVEESTSFFEDIFDDMDIADEGNFTYMIQNTLDKIKKKFMTRKTALSIINVDDMTKEINDKFWDLIDYDKIDSYENHVKVFNMINDFNKSLNESLSRTNPENENNELRKKINKIIIHNNESLIECNRGLLYHNYISEGMSKDNARKKANEDTDTIYKKFKKMSDEEKVQFIINSQATESTSFFEDVFDDMDIVEEARKWNAIDKVSYKVTRKLQTNTIALNNQLNQQKKLLAKEYAEASKIGTFDTFYKTVEKRKHLMQQKINGEEIKDKKTLQKFIDLYDSYLNKQNANESLMSLFGDMFIEDMDIAEEGKLTTAQRKALPDSAFGLPSERKYPLVVQDENGEYEWNHLKDAIAYFHTCKDEEKKKELATNIAKVIRKYKVDISISENNKIRNYAKFK